MEETGGAHPQTLGLGAQVACERIGQSPAQPSDPPAVAVHVGEAERRRGFRDVPEGCPEVGHRVVLGVPGQGVGDEVAVGRRGGQQVDAARHVHGQLLEDQSQGGGVLDEMVGGQEQVAPL